MPTRRIFIVAGEASGDMHAARLMNALKRRYAAVGTDCYFEGIGGAAMEREGLRSLVPLAQVNVVGFWEVAKRYGFFRRLLADCGERLQRGSSDTQLPFDAFVAVDFPGFNMRLAALARRAGVKVCWYIAPQLWAWGAERAARFSTLIDRLLVVFPFEVEFFRQHGINAEFVGHPLLDDEAFGTTLAADTEREPVLALLPGSRAQELKHNLPLMLRAAERVVREHPWLRVSVAAAPHLASELYEPAVRSCGVHVRLTHDSRALMRSARVGIIKTGTSTLEAALLGLPFVMAYKTSALTYHIAKRKITLPHIALANIVAGKMVVQECIQDDATPERLANELLRILGNTPETALCRQQMLAEFFTVREQLGHAGAADHAAKHVAALLEKVV
jgi:lipid-A-disaccharide synthase